MFVALQAAREELEDAKCSWVKINFAILFNVCQSTPGCFQKNAKISAIKQYVGWVALPWFNASKSVFYTILLRFILNLVACGFYIFGRLSL